MKLLLLSYYYPPQGSAGSLRNYAIAKYLQTFFGEVRVGTAQFPACSDGSLRPPEGVYDFGIPNFDYRFLFQATLKNANGGTFLLRRIRQMLNRLFPGILAEGGPWYIIRGFQLASRHSRDAKDQWIYSSFRPMADHWIAFLLTLRYRNVRWIADFRDLPPGLGSFLPFQRILVRYLLKRTTVVTTVSEGLASVLRKMHHNVLVLPNAYCPLDMADSDCGEDSTCFTLVYTGSLYARQSLFPLLEALESLLDEGLMHPSRLRLIYAGKDGGIWDAWVKAFTYPSLLENKGLLSVAEARQLQQKAGMNILLTWADNRHQGILTSKLYEYLYAEKPILGIVNGVPDGELERVFQQSAAGVLVYAHEAYLRPVRHFILEKYREWLAFGRTSTCVQPTAMEGLHWKDNITLLTSLLQNETSDEGSVSKYLVP